MAYIKSEVMAKDLQKGDIFRSVECVGNLRQTFEYEIVSAVKVESKQHPDFPDLTLYTAIFKVKNRRNGAGKTKKYNGTATIIVWREGV